MNIRSAMVLLVVLSSMLLAPRVCAAPVPSVVPKSWQLNFDFVDPQSITLKLPGQVKPQTFWYILYTVTNNTGQDVQFFPQFEVLTNTMQVLPGDPGINPAVFEAIKQRHRPTFPLLMEPVKALGPLLQGPDNARSSVVIWPQFDIKANRFTVYVAGLSGESILLPNPNYKRGQPEYEQKKLADGSEIKVSVNPKFFTLRKTLAIRYILPGDEQTRASARAGLLDKEWIMR
jgi:hypothetical protein